MKKTILVAMLGAMVFSGAYAEKWVYVGGTKDFTVLANVDSISCEAGICSIWTGTINIDKTKKHDSDLTYYEAKCKTKKFRHTYIVEYYKGKIINSYSRNDPDFRPTIPGTIGQHILKFACGKKYSSDEILNIPFHDAVSTIQKGMRTKEYQDSFK